MNNQTCRRNPNYQAQSKPRARSAGALTSALALLVVLAGHAGPAKGNDLVIAGEKAQASQHYRQAMADFRKAARTGSGRAMFNIGLLYDNGQGVAQNYTKAMLWYRKAAAAGNGLAMCNIGVLYAQSHGVPQDYTKALEWYRKGAAAGSGWAMALIGLLYQYGLGVPQDYSRATKWYKRAEKQGGKAGAFARKYIDHLRAAEANRQ